MPKNEASRPGRNLASVGFFQVVSVFISRRSARWLKEDGPGEFGQGGRLEWHLGRGGLRGGLRRPGSLSLRPGARSLRLRIALGPGFFLLGLGYCGGASSCGLAGWRATSAPRAWQKSSSSGPQGDPRTMNRRAPGKPVRLHASLSPATFAQGYRNAGAGVPYVPAATPCSA